MWANALLVTNSGINSIVYLCRGGCRRTKKTQPLKTHGKLNSNELYVMSKSSLNPSFD